MRDHYKSETHSMSCSKGCSCWCECFVLAEPLGTIRSSSSPRHVRLWKKIAEIQEVFLLFGWRLFFEPFSVMVTSLTTKSTAIILLSSSLNQMGAVVQAGSYVYTCQQTACSGIPSGPTWDVFTAQSCLRWADREVAWVWRSTGGSHHPLSDIAALLLLERFLK